MRIQHNIMAMNSYRNYNNNANALGKNLEKLSSGYRINRAGDDAAGLAISEKMRAQITGLDAAQKNVQDGISLVKTAEGALQEVQDMLNRMKYLAVQSANGTYENEVDRKALQDEVNALKDEINRIADSANFNGMKLLDGSLAATGKTSTIANSVDLSKLGVDLTVDGLKTIDSQKSFVKTEPLFTDENGAAANFTVENGDSLTLTINYTDGEGKAQSKDVTVFIGNNSAGTVNYGLYWDDGTEDGYYLGKDFDLAADGTLTAEEFTKAIEQIALKDSDLKANFKVADADDNQATAKGLSFEARVPGTEGAQITSMTLSKYDKDDAGNTEVNTWNIGFTTTTNVEDELTAIDLSKAKVFDLYAADTSTVSTKDINEAIFEINGEKFVFIQEGKETDVDFQKALREAGVTHWVEVGAADTIDGDDVKTMVNKISTETGLLVQQGSTTVAAADGEGWSEGDMTWVANDTADDTQIVLRPREETKSTNTGGLTLQIGDTAEDFNQLKVQVSDMHVKSLGMDDFDISTLENAQKAERLVTDAINYVSSQRGVLGATQNRLEHTANNLSVMEENIQNAESAIRDTDIADEMTAYTKNNILLQSAQAMLAQANQVPQGVLQLLQ